MDRMELPEPGNGMEHAVRAVKANIRNDYRLYHLEPQRLARDSILKFRRHQPARENAYPNNQGSQPGQDKYSVHEHIDEVIPPPFSKHALFFVQREQPLERNKDYAHEDKSLDIKEIQEIVEQLHGDHSSLRAPAVRRMLTHEPGAGGSSYPRTRDMISLDAHLGRLRPAARHYRQRPARPALCPNEPTWTRRQVYHGSSHPHGCPARRSHPRPRELCPYHDWQGWAGECGAGEQDAGRTREAPASIKDPVAVGAGDGAARE